MTSTYIFGNYDRDGFVDIPGLSHLHMIDDISIFDSLSSFMDANGANGDWFICSTKRPGKRVLRVWSPIFIGDDGLKAALRLSVKTT